MTDYATWDQALVTYLFSKEIMRCRGIEKSLVRSIRTEKVGSWYELCEVSGVEPHQRKQLLAGLGDYLRTCPPAVQHFPGYQGIPVRFEVNESHQMEDWALPIELEEEESEEEWGDQESSGSSASSASWQMSDVDGEEADSEYVPPVHFQPAVSPHHRLVRAPICYGKTAPTPALSLPLEPLPIPDFTMNNEVARMFAQMGTDTSRMVRQVQADWQAEHPF